MPRTSPGGPEIIWRSSERMKDLFRARRRQECLCCPMKIPFMLPPGSVQCPKKTGRHDQLKWYMRSFGFEHSQQSWIQNHWQREHWLAVRPLCSPCQWFLCLKLAWLCLGSAPWPAALLCIWGWPGALSKTKDDLRAWCRGTGDLFKLRNFLTPDGSRLSCVVRAKSPYDPTFFAPRRIE